MESMPREFAGCNENLPAPRCEVCQDTEHIWVGRWATCPACVPYDDGPDEDVIDTGTSDTTDHAPTEVVDEADRRWWAEQTQNDGEWGWWLERLRRSLEVVRRWDREGG